MEEDAPVTSVIKVNLTLQDLLVSYTTMVWQQRKRCSNKEGWCIRESQQRADTFILWPILSALNNGLKTFQVHQMFHGRNSEILPYRKKTPKHQTNCKDYE